MPMVEVLTEGHGLWNDANYMELNACLFAMLFILRRVQQDNDHVQKKIREGPIPGWTGRRKELTAWIDGVV